MPPPPCAASRVLPDAIKLSPRKNVVATQPSSPVAVTTNSAIKQSRKQMQQQNRDQENKGKKIRRPFLGGDFIHVSKLQWNTAVLAEQALGCCGSGCISQIHTVLKSSFAADAMQGGQLGWRTGSRLPALFVEALTKLQPGEYSPCRMC